MPSLVPATALTVADLAATWSRVYDGYYVPMTFTEERMHRHLRTGGIALERSVLAHADGEWIGLSLLGVRGTRGWIGGFGIVPARRRRGIATELLNAQLAAAAAAGLATVQLEVLTQNPAARLYERGGFRTQRRLGVLEAQVAATPHNGAREVTVDLALQALDALSTAAPRCWQRERASLAAADGAVAYLSQGDGRDHAVLVCERSDAGPLRIQALEGDARSFSGLVRHACARAGTSHVLLVNEPEGTAAHAAVTALGGAVTMSQWEMRVALPQPRDS